MVGNDDHKRRFLDLLSLDNPEAAYREIKKLSSDLSDNDHMIRSCIFDLHAAVEVELRRIFYHHFKSMLFLTDDESQNENVENDFERMIERLSFMDIYRVLGPILKHWPYPELESISDINNLRNKMAHSGSVENARYKSRNPFHDADAFAELYFDVWAITQCMAKFFDWTIESPRMRLKQYREKYGEL